TTVVWLCSPNNPTGNLIQQAKLDQFISNVSPEVLIVLDEAYVEYITDKEYRNSITYLPKYKNVVILRTFSKVYGLASFRIGYAIAHEELIANLDPLREPFNTTSLSQGVAIAALSDQSFVEHSRAVNKQGIAQFESFCLKHNLFMYPTQANFVLIDIKTDSDKIFEELMKKGFIVRSGNALGVPGFIRITIGSIEQNTELIEKLTEILTDLGVVHA
ncbi:MAG: aminotransferase class I/II-fold pyridoxal phosphate-dependent enzyme, partial [Paenisporosarcina sp.]